nr:hypothetical protein [Pseudomonas toyotomiensis]
MFEKPSVFLVDIDQRVSRELRSVYSSVVSGTLGVPYTVRVDGTWLPVIQHEELIGYEESDLIVVDLTTQEIAERPRGDKHTPDSEIDIWAKCDKGWIDARIRNVILAKENINQIVRNGGVLVIFSGPESPMDFQLAYSRLNQLSNSSVLTSGLWSLVEPMERLIVTPKTGKVIRVIDDGPLGRLFERYLDETEFTCTFKSRWYDDRVWNMLAENKYGECVSAVAKHGDGVVLIFPQVKNKAGFLLELFGETLPEIIPNLFPEIERGKWTHRSEYEFEEIKRLQSKRDEIISRTELELKMVQSEIEQYREENGWIHHLITSTGDELAEAVKMSLSELGFRKVVDVDQIRDAEGKSRREDLRIEDGSPLLVVDIKGVGGKAADEDVMQAVKHALINIRELKRPDVQGLSIINQQRHLPPLERENSEPFRAELLSYAEEAGLGMMTAFDLYRMVLNMRRNQWRSEWVMPLFYMLQRVRLLPTHYRRVGVVSKVFKGAFGVEILEGEVCVGDRIAIEGEIFFEEISVDSIEVEKKQVNRVSVGDKAGFIWPDSVMKLREKMAVYVIPKSVLSEAVEAPLP